ncbi:MAG: DNA topoisomerase IV subunit B, partial [Candidatus Binatia bacterium]
KIELGKNVLWANDDKEKEQILARQNGNAAKAYVQRFKGLGEMNPSTLKETTLDPRSRTLLQVTIDDAERTESAIQTLMGKEVQPRFAFIMNRAPKVTEVDV